MEEQYILYMSTFPPRECGIATFAQDLVSNIDKRYHPHLRSIILAMNKNETNTYNYQKKVAFQLDDSDIDKYISLAKKINRIDKIKLVSIQHEFGIFGGQYGSYLNAFLEILEKPAIITFHSVLPAPDVQMIKTIQAIARRVNAIIVMNERGRKILREVYGVRTDIHVIYHGIPYTPFGSGEKEKKHLGYKDRLVLCSFGMINPGKGYEYVIDALPRVIQQFPNVIYLVVGETHPVVRGHEGERYRKLLEQRVKRLGIENHVKFYNKYVTLDEIIMYLRACDVYISSGLDPNQITSGTLSYAIGCGRPVISTPFLHALEDVTPERGLLVNFRDPRSFSDAIIQLLSNPTLRKTMGSHAYHTTRNRTWENVAGEYFKVFKRHIDLEEGFIEVLPKIRFRHLLNLTDNFGVIQFAKNTKPDLASGYTLDDVSRGLIAISMHYEKTKQPELVQVMETYLNFIKYVEADGKFYNFVNYKKEVDREIWSEDAHGRAIWALGYLLSLEKIPPALKKEAQALFDRSFGVNQCISSPRAMCFMLIGYYYLHQAHHTEQIKNLISELARSLRDLYFENSTKDWHWFEKYLTYDNSKFSEALFYAYLSTGNEEYLTIAQESLNFLISVCFQKDIFCPIGQRGWYSKEGRRAYFDQQPLEAGSMVQALAIAHHITKHEEYFTKAMKAFSWFLGRNMINHALYNRVTGGCYDGLGETTININQGAESTISYLLARLTLEDLSLYHSPQISFLKNRSE